MSNGVLATTATILSVATSFVIVTGIFYNWGLLTVYSSSLLALLTPNDFIFSFLRLEFYIYITIIGSLGQMLQGFHALEARENAQKFDRNRYFTHRLTPYLVFCFAAGAGYFWARQIAFVDWVLVALWAIAIIGPLVFAAILFRKLYSTIDLRFGQVALPVIFFSHIALMAFVGGVDDSYSNRSLGVAAMTSGSECDITQVFERYVMCTTGETITIVPMRDIKEIRVDGNG